MSRWEVARVFGPTLPSHSVVGAPVAVVAGHQAASDEQDQVHEPPDSQASKSEQLPNSGTRVAQAETINPKTAQEEGVQQRGDEIVSSVFDAGYLMQGDELSGSGTFYIIESSAHNWCVVHLFLSLATPPGAAMAHLLKSTEVAYMVYGILTVDELFW